MGNCFSGVKVRQAEVEKRVTHSGRSVSAAADDGPMEQYLSKVLSHHTVPYAEPHKQYIRDQLIALTTKHPSLTPKTTNTHKHKGRSFTLLQTKGTLPMLYNSVTYNIPISLLLPDSFPTLPPFVFINPTRGMAIKMPHPFVNPISGVVLIPYLTNWVFPGSSLVGLAKELSDLFAMDPPLYSKKVVTVVSEVPPLGLCLLIVGAFII